jgi:hypothetical protein
MLESLNQTRTVPAHRKVFAPPKFNRIWGLDFLLMDSKTFMGGKNKEEYDKIINIFSNVWNMNEYRLFDNARLQLLTQT